jgi:hypothetical protein
MYNKDAFPDSLDHWPHGALAKRVLGIKKAKMKQYFVEYNNFSLNRIGLMILGMTHSLSETFIIFIRGFYMMLESNSAACQHSYRRHFLLRMAH